MFILVQCAIVLGSGFLTLSPNHKNHRNNFILYIKSFQDPITSHAELKRKTTITAKKTHMFKLNLPVLL